MTKFYLFIAFAIASLSGFSQATCIIDSNNTDFFSPRPDSIPCIERNVAYTQVIQIAVPATFDLQDLGAPIPYILTIDSVVITGVNGLPNGIQYASNPANGVFYGGTRGCADVYGTTTDPVGNYPITFIGTFTAHGNPFPPFFDGDTTLDFATLQSQAQGMFDLFVDVINPGDECRPAQASGIGSFNNNLNTFLSVYPNPTNGLFTVAMNTGGKINGEINVLNTTGQTVMSQPVDITGSYATVFNLSELPKGLYTVVVKTTEGIAAKNVSVE